MRPFCAFERSSRSQFPAERSSNLPLDVGENPGISFAARSTLIMIDMRNAFQTMIDKCQRNKSQLTRISVLLGELSWSQNDALLKTAEGSDDRAHSVWLKEQIKEASHLVDEQAGWK
jgi:hypothetical protein